MFGPLDSVTITPLSTPTAAPTSAFPPNADELVQQIAGEVQNLKPSSEQTWAANLNSLAAAAALPDSEDCGRHVIQVDARAKQASDEIDSAQATELDLTAKFNTLANLRANGHIDSATASTIAQLAKDFGTKVDSEAAALNKVRTQFHDGNHPSQVKMADQIGDTRASQKGDADRAWHAAAPREYMKETHDEFESALRDLIGTGSDNHGKISRDVGELLYTVSGDGLKADPIAVQQFKSDSVALEQLEKKLSDHLNAATDLSALQPGSAARSHAQDELRWAQTEFKIIDDEVWKADDAIAKVGAFPDNGLPRLTIFSPGLE